MLAGAGVGPAAADEPQANFRADPGRGGVPLTVRFTSTSSDADGDLVGFFWQFGDGQTSIAEHPTHVYQAPGKYDVTLTVTDSLGQQDEKLAKDSVTVDPPALAAALLPVSRSVQVDQPATAFVTVINLGAVAATAVGLEIHPSTAPGGVPGAPLPAAFGFQVTDPLTNQVTGAPGVPVDIPAGQSQSYVVSLAPAGPLEPTDVRFEIKGTNTSPARIVPGLNTLLLSAAAGPVPDVVAIAAIAAGTPAVEIPGPAGTAAFAVASANVGAGGNITVSADTGAVPLALGLAVCPTDPATGACVSAAGPAVTVPIGAGATPTFSVFVTGAGTVPFDPEHHRIFVRFADDHAVLRGATSVAVKTR